MKVSSVNPEVLRWARETAGYSLKAAANKIGKTPAVIENWESGQDYPTYVQLEQLAYKVYKRPLALFFFPAPPEEEAPQQSFRTLPKQEIAAMSPRMHYLRKKAQAMQIGLAELYNETNPSKKRITKDLRFHLDGSVQKMAGTVRKYLGIDLAAQVQWSTATEACKAWREALEKNGVFVFKDAFREDGFSGFCLYHEEFPVIYVNNSMPDTRQNFTFFHELAHLLLHIGGVDFRSQDHLSRLQGESQKIEVLCNHFSAEFLVPITDFNKQIQNINPRSEGNLNDLAERYSVSREVILRKLLDKNLVEQKFYETKVEEWNQEISKREEDEGEGNYYNNQIAYIGRRFLEYAFSCYYQNRISIEELASHLNMKVKSVREMETRVVR